MTRKIDINKADSVDPSSSEITQQGNRQSTTDGGFYVDVPEPDPGQAPNPDGSNGAGRDVPRPGVGK